MPHAHPHPPTISRARRLLDFYGDVHVGTIARLSGVPVDEDQWGWDCGFYAGTKPHQDRGDTAATFHQARADFEVAWHRLLPTLTEEDFDRWREARDFTAKKYSMWKRGELLPSQKPNTMMRCPCGATFDSHDPSGSYVHRGHIYKEQATDGIRR
jgi:hypothetical protein